MLTSPRYQNWADSVYNYQFSIAEGSIRSGKSVQAVRCFADQIIACRVQTEALFLAGAVNESMAQALIGECNGFGLRFIFGNGCIYKKYKGRSALFIHYVINGKYFTRWVIFCGGSKAGYENAIKGLSIQGAEIEEINLQTEAFVNEVQDRMAVADRPFLIGTMNPSMSKHWIYRGFIDSPSRGIPSGRMNYLHATLVDNPILTAERIKQIQDTYDKDSIWYKGYILGERMNPAGAIYRLHEYNVIDKIEPESYDSYVVVCDQGETISATAITLDAVKYDKDKGFYHMDVLKEYHHINSNTGDGEKHFEDYANDLADFVIESSKVMSSFPSKVIVDQDPEFYHQAVLAFQRKGLDPYIIQFPNKLEIEDRIKRGVGFMHKGQLRFYKDCSNTIEDFKNAEYDEKEIEKTGKFVRMKVYTEGFGHLDMVDSVEYAFTFFLDVLDPENESAD